MKWLVWLFGAMLAWIAYDVSANITRRFTDDHLLPILVGTLATVAAAVVTYLVKRRMPVRETRPRSSVSDDERWRRDRDNGWRR